MSNAEMDLVRKQRRALQNPYAYIEYLDEAQRDEIPREASAQSLASSRKLLENPHAYLDGSGGISALAKSSLGDVSEPSRIVALGAGPNGVARRIRPPAISYSDSDIETHVRSIHKKIWRERQSVWGDEVPTDPIDMLDPAVALGLLNYECHLDEGLGQFRTTDGVIEVAGLIDRKSRTVRVSRQFSANVRTFTMAHELGHAVLHASSGGVHRDKPLDGSNSSRDKGEYEADRFATLFLMPDKLVRALFLKLFRDAPFVLNEDTSFALAGCSVSDLRQGCQTRRQLSRLLASAQSYDGRHFDPSSATAPISADAMAIRLLAGAQSSESRLYNSLASRFRVSTEAMAIRLEELGLVGE
jgi:hypothetical protein